MTKRLLDPKRDNFTSEEVMSLVRNNAGNTIGLDGVIRDCRWSPTEKDVEDLLSNSVPSVRGAVLSRGDVKITKERAIKIFKEESLGIASILLSGNKCEFDDELLAVAMECVIKCVKNGRAFMAFDFLIGRKIKTPRLDQLEELFHIGSPDIFEAVFSRHDWDLPRSLIESWLANEKVRGESRVICAAISHKNFKPSSNDFEIAITMGLKYGKRSALDVAECFINLGTPLTSIQKSLCTESPLLLSFLLKGGYNFSDVEQRLIFKNHKISSWESVRNVAALVKSRCYIPREEDLLLLKKESELNGFCNLVYKLVIPHLTEALENQKLKEIYNPGKRTRPAL